MTNLILCNPELLKNLTISKIQKICGVSLKVAEAGNMAKTFSGTGAVVGDSASSNKERVDFGQNIGMYNDPILGYVPTSNGIIHHSSKGTHIVPAKPN